MTMQISVIIPCRNGANYLAEAIASIREQGVECEIIVVDDGSTDDTAALARSLGCVTITQEAAGPSRARNTGVHAAQGNFILFLDHDDLLAPGALNAMLEACDEATDLVTARLRDFISPELSEEQRACLKVRPDAYGGLLTGAYLFRRGITEAAGGFDEALPGGEVVDFLLRCHECGARTKQLDLVSCLRRVHMSNSGRVKREANFKGYTASLRSRLRGARQGA